MDSNQITDTISTLPEHLHAPTRLALACHHWQEAGRSRELTASSPAGDELADAEWNAESDRHHALALALIDGVDTIAALDALRDDKVRGRVGLIVRDLFGVSTDTIDAHAFGPGWESAGSVTVTIPPSETFFVVVNISENSGVVVSRKGPAWPEPGGWTYQGVTGMHGTLLLESESEAECQAALDAWLAEYD